MCIRDRIFCFHNSSTRSFIETAKLSALIGTALLLYRSCGKKSIPGCRKRNKECAQGYGSHTCAHQRDFADTAHSKSTKSADRTVSYGIFSSENSYLWTVAALTHSRAERVACDNLHLRASAHHWHVSAFLCNRKFLGIPYYTKKAPSKGCFLLSDNQRNRRAWEDSNSRHLGP